MLKRVRWYRVAALVIFYACVVVLLVRTWHWPQISDDVLMHYVVFLMRHGWTPYRDIVDVNMPGAYLVDAATASVAGTSDVLWRLFDWALLAVAGVSFVSMLPRKAWFPALFVAGIFTVTHVSDGVAQAGQRDFIVAVLLLAGCAFLFHAVRTGGLLAQFAWGLCAGLAATIKPQALLLPLILAPLSMVATHGRRREPGKSLLAALAGILVPLVAVGVWLGSQGVLSAFVANARGLTAYHAGMARHSLPFLLGHAVPSLLLPFLVLSLILLALRRERPRWDEGFALVGVAFGVFSFCLQGKGYPYHRYPLLGFLLLFTALEISAAWEQQRDRAKWTLRTQRAIALVMVLYGTLWIAPAGTARALRYDWRSTPSLTQLTADLRGLQPPGGSLNGNVQCMDTMAGCITVLDRMRILPATGFLYDCYFFAPSPSPVKEQQRERFLAAIRRHPPLLFVVTSQWCLNLPNGYAKLGQWPAFASYLATDYSLVEERSWAVRNPRYLATWPFGYRIYRRKTAQ